MEQVALRRKIDRHQRIMLRFVDFCFAQFEHFFDGGGALLGPAREGPSPQRDERLDAAQKLSQLVLAMLAYIRSPRRFFMLLKEKQARRLSHASAPMTPAPNNPPQMTVRGDRLAPPVWTEEGPMAFVLRICAKGRRMVRRDMALRFGPLTDDLPTTEKMLSMAASKIGVDAATPGGETIKPAAKPQSSMPRRSPRRADLYQTASPLCLLPKQSE
ncbi:MAG: hypothetical protein AAGL18_05305 [Pseudomonadota bacterium]